MEQGQRLRGWRGWRGKGDGAGLQDNGLFFFSCCVHVVQPCGPVGERRGGENKCVGRTDAEPPLGTAQASPLAAVAAIASHTPRCAAADLHGRCLDHNVGKVAHAQRLKHLLRVRVNLNDARVDSRHLGNKVHAPLALLLLQLQGDTPDGALLDARHQMLWSGRDRHHESIQSPIQFTQYTTKTSSSNIQ